MTAGRPAVDHAVPRPSTGAARPTAPYLTTLVEARGKGGRRLDERT